MRGSPIATKRAFLERKGLNNAEIEEAFKRVPEDDASAGTVTASPSPLPGNNQGLVTYRTQQPGHQAAAQPQPQQQAQQQQALVPMAPSAQPMPPAQQEQPIRWTQVSDASCPPLYWGCRTRMLQSVGPVLLHGQSTRAFICVLQVVLGASVFAAGAYAVGTLVIPYVRNMYQSWQAATRYGCRAS